MTDSLRDAVEILGAVAKAEIEERDATIEELRALLDDLLVRLENSDREKELLRVRIEELSNDAAREAA